MSSTAKQADDVDAGTEITTEDAGDLTAFKKNILTVLCGMDAPKGLAVKRELESYYGTEINHGRLYPNLDDLVDAGYIEKGELDRRTNSYEITDAGRKVLKAHDQWEIEYRSN